MLVSCCAVSYAKELIVTNPEDPPPGVPAKGPGLCLRDALDQAGPGDTITYQVPGILRVVWTSTRLFNTGTTYDGTGRTFSVSAVGSSPYTLISTSPGPGGKVILKNMNILGGGKTALAITTGECELDSCTISSANNTDTSSKGGGVWVKSGTKLTMNDCRITNNTTSTSGGGGIYVDGSLNLNRCTVDNNSAPDSSGGGIVVNANATASITNSTVAFNGAHIGAGIYTYYYTSNCIVNASTIAYNSISGSAVDCGGGIGNDGNFSLYNSIVAGNAGAFNLDIDNGGTFTGSGNAVGPSYGYNSGVGDWTTTGDATGVFTNANSDTGYLYLDTAVTNHGGITPTLSLTNSNTIAKSIYSFGGGEYSASGAAYSFSELGNSMAMAADNSVVITGAPDNGYGSAPVFIKNGNSWSQNTTLAASDGANGDCFGQSTAISANGNVAIVGASGKDSSKGRVYAFVNNNGSWIQTDSMKASDGAGGDLFGYGTAMSGDGNTAVIGAYGKNSGRGEVYTFGRNTNNTWQLLDTLVAADGAAKDDFGQDVAISEDGNTIVIGSPYNGSAGAAYALKCSAGYWRSSKLTSSDSAAADAFGKSVAVSNDGNTVIVGAYNKQVGSNKSQGAAYVFNYNDNNDVWTQKIRLTASDGSASDRFGFNTAVSEDGSTALVGAYNKDSGEGEAYVFDYNSDSDLWSQRDTIAETNGSSGDNFGYSAAISSDGTIVAIGALTENSLSGAAYIYYGASGDTSKLPDTDQRGYQRAESGYNCIGAYELL